MSEKSSSPEDHIAQLMKLLDWSVLGQVAFGAEAVEGCADLVASRRAWRSPLFRAISPTAWRRMYRRSRVVIATLEDAFAPMDWPSSAARSRLLLMRGALNWLGRTKGERTVDDPTFRSASPGVRAGFRLLCRAFTSEMRVYNDLVALPPKQRRPVVLAAMNEGWEPDATQIPAVLFLMFVVIRCWTETGKQPAGVLRAARTGNDDALEFLLRIDPHIHGDRVIARRLTAARIESPALFRRFTKAMQSATAPNARATRANLGGLMKIVSVTGKLTEPVIRAAFDGAADVATDGEVSHDFSVPDSPEAFAKAMKRWQGAAAKFERKPGQK